MSENLPPLRVGHDERSAAIKALDEHLSAGRLDPEEYGERMATASLARTRAELEQLFIDLPAPHPFPDSVPRSWSPYPMPPRQSAYPVPGRRVVPWPVVAAAVIALMPLIALTLFIVTKTWVFFLLIPAVGMVFGRRGPRGPRGRYSSGRRYY